MSVFGTPTKEYSDIHLRSIIKSAKTYEELQQAKLYLVSYFARADVGVFRWIPKNQNINHYNAKDVYGSLIPSISKKFYDDDGNEKIKFDLLSWFTTQTPFFSIEVNPFRPRAYQLPDDGYYINIFSGFLHPNPPSFYQFNKEIRDQVKLILNHMREVLCSSDKQQELYMMGLILRIAMGQKMQKSMFLYSGPGTGKTMLTWFLRERVLGPKITLKTANEKIITGQFNKELEGKVLLVLEEMSNSKSTDWITFANRLKDFIDSDTLTIEEKYKTPYSVTNITNLIISSNNSKTIRLDKNDRRYFIPDVSEKYVENGIGMDHYYAPLDKAIKDPEVGKAFYSYALEYVKLNPDFNERKIPMTKTKLMMIKRDVNSVHEFIKQEYLRKFEDIDESSSNLYTRYKNWFLHNFGNKKKPSIIQEFTHAMAELGLKPKSKRVGDRSQNKKAQWYLVSYNELYAVFRKKNLIDDAENIVEPEDYQDTANTELSLKSEVFPIEEPPTNTDSISEIDNDEVYESSSDTEDEELIAKNRKSKETKTTPPKIPPKPEHLSRALNNQEKITKNISEKSEDAKKQSFGCASEAESPDNNNEALELFIEFLGFAYAETNEEANLNSQDNENMEEAKPNTETNEEANLNSQDNENMEEAKPNTETNAKANEELAKSESTININKKVFSDDADDDWYNELDKFCRSKA
jgi:hypothetical protein